MKSIKLITVIGNDLFWNDRDYEKGEYFLNVIRNKHNELANELLHDKNIVDTSMMNKERHFGWTYESEIFYEEK